jgi:hypothetical protein
MTLIVTPRRTAADGVVVSDLREASVREVQP